MQKKFLNHVLVGVALTSSLWVNGCGSYSSPSSPTSPSPSPAASALPSSLLTADSSSQTLLDEEAFQIESTAAASPQFKDQVQAFKNLSPDQRKAKLKELRDKNPDFFKGKGFHREGDKSRTGFRHFSGPNGKGPDGNEKAQHDQFAKDHPELAAQFQSLKDLTPAQRMAKLKEFRDKNPDLFKGFPGKDHGHSQPKS